jgi:hypothetical protein
MENAKSTSPHYLVLVSLQAPPHFPLSSLYFAHHHHLLYIYYSLIIPALHHGNKHEGAAVRTWILGAQTRPYTASPIYLSVLVLDSTVSLLGASPPELMFVIFLHLFYVIVIRILTCTNDPIKNV